MGLYLCKCSNCNAQLNWFSGNNSDQLCHSCLEAKNSGDEVTVKYKPVTFDHELIYYIPVFQTNFDVLTGEPCDPYFTYSLADATQDSQMAYSQNPDYVLELRGHFKATTKTFKIKDR